MPLTSISFNFRSVFSMHTSLCAQRSVRSCRLVVMHTNLSIRTCHTAHVCFMIKNTNEDLSNEVISSSKDCRNHACPLVFTIHPSSAVEVHDGTVLRETLNSQDDRKDQDSVLTRYELSFSMNNISVSYTTDVCHHVLHVYCLVSL